MELDKAIESIFKLRGVIDHVYFKGFFNTKYRSEGMSAAHIVTLIILKFDGPSRMNCVAEKVDLEKGSFTPVAKRLFDMGYISKSKDPSDKRATILTLTEQGRSFAKELMGNHRTYIRDLVSIFSLEEIEEYFQAVDKVLLMTSKIDEFMKDKK